MKTKNYHTILLALAVVIAGVFVTLTTHSAYAESVSKPWNVDVVITYNGDTFCYNLEQQISGITDEADARGFYLGYNGRKALSKR